MLIEYIFTILLLYQVILFYFNTIEIKFSLVLNFFLICKCTYMYIYIYNRIETNFNEISLEYIYKNKNKKSHDYSIYFSI